MVLNAEMESSKQESSAIVVPPKSAVITHAAIRAHASSEATQYAMIQMRLAVPAASLQQQVQSVEQAEVHVIFKKSVQDHQDLVLPMHMSRTGKPAVRTLTSSVPRVFVPAEISSANRWLSRERVATTQTPATTILAGFDVLKARIPSSARS